MNYAQPGGLNERKQALIKALRSGRGGAGAGGAARLSGSVPFGAIARLGFRPDARSVFGRPERFNFSGSPQGMQDAFSELSGLAQQGPPNGGQQTPAAPTGGLGPAAPDGAGAGIPQNQGVSSQGFSGGNEGGGGYHFLEGGIPKGGTNPITGRNPLDYLGQGSVPGNVAAAFEGDGAMTSGVSAWLQANPWYLEQMLSGAGGGGYSSGGGAVL